MQQAITLSNITLAAENMEEMVQFYDSVFDTRLMPYSPFEGVQGFRGVLAGIEFVIVPNEVAKVHAEQNRQQLTFTVENVEVMVDTAIGAGGDPLDEAGLRQGRMMGAVYDPDGNSIVFVEYEDDA